MLPNHATFHFRAPRMSIDGVMPEIRKIIRIIRQGAVGLNRQQELAVVYACRH